MSYTTTPIANRLGYNRGWMFQLIPQNTNRPNAASMVYLKSYFILKEYLRFYQINLLSFYIQPFTPTINLIHLMVYKHIRYPRKKPHPVFIDRLNKQGYFKILNVFKKEHNVDAIKAISAVGSKNTWRHTIPLLQKSNLYSKALHLISQKIKQVSKRTPVYGLKQNVKFTPKTLINFMRADVRKLVKFKRKRDLIFIVQLGRLDVSLRQFCTTLHEVHLQELILCAKNVLNNQSKEEFEVNLGLSTLPPKSIVLVKRRNKTNKKLTQKNLKFLANARKKKFLLLPKLKILLQSDIAIRLRLAKKIMSYWKLVNGHRDQFYLNYHGVTLKSFLSKNLCKDNKITAIILGKGKKILQNHDFAKQIIFSMLGLHTGKVKPNKSNKYFYLYSHIFQRKNNLNKSSTLLAELKTIKSINKNPTVSKQPLQLLHKVIPSQNFILKRDIKIKKEIYKPVLNNQLQLNYLFESYLQNVCKIPSVVKVISTSPNVWLKKTYQNVKSKPRLKRAAEGRFFKRLLFAFINAERYMTPQLIADLIAHELAIPRKHKPLLRNINALFDAVHSRYILGYKIVVDGKLNGVMKSTKQIIKFKGKDKMPVQEFHKRVLYALGVSRTYTGLFGVRVWLYY